jgi:hypothetical protein
VEAGREDAVKKRHGTEVFWTHNIVRAQFIFMIAIDFHDAVIPPAGLKAAATVGRFPVVVLRKKASTESSNDFTGSTGPEAASSAVQA